jgi:hypothetical protein
MKGQDIIRRQVKMEYVLPVPVKSISFDKNQARLELGISNEEVILLTIAASYKLKSDLQYNYFQEIYNVLQKYSNVKVYVIGIDSHSEFVTGLTHDRMYLLGQISNTSLYEAACDIYVEGFPVVSMTSLLQVAAKKKAVHLIYNPSELSTIFCKDQNIWTYTKNVEEWRLELDKLIEDETYRSEKSNQQLLYMKEHHIIGLGWSDRLNTFYKKVKAITHSVNRKSKSFFISSENEKFLLSFTSKNTTLAGVIITENIFFKLCVHVVSASLEISKKLMK